jgi:hypothetical protein
MILMAVPYCRIKNTTVTAAMFAVPDTTDSTALTAVVCRLLSHAA